MPLTDRIKRYGISGVGYPVGPVNLRKPLSGGGLAGLSQLSGSNASADRWEVSSGNGISAGDYTFRVGPYSEAGFKATHRAIGGVRVFLQSGGVSNRLAQVTCLGHRRPGDSTKSVALGPFTAEEGDRMWLVVERKDSSTLKYQVEVEFTAATSNTGSYRILEVIDSDYLSPNPLLNNNGTDNGHTLQCSTVDAEGNFYLGGWYLNDQIYTATPTVKGYAMMLKVTPAGAIAWKRIYGFSSYVPAQAGNSTDITAINYPLNFISICTSADGNHIYGLMDSWVGTEARTQLVKMDLNGAVVSSIYIATYIDNEVSGFAPTVQSTSDGAVVLYNPVGGVNRVIKILINGSSMTVQWVQIVDTGGTEVLMLATDSSGNVFYYIRQSDLVFNIVKLNSAGSQQWVKTYQFNGLTVGYHVMQTMKIDSSGSIMLSGGYVNSFSEPFVVRIDGEGVVSWSKRDSSSALPAGYSQKRVYLEAGGTSYSSGGCYIAGVLSLDNNAFENSEYALIVKFSSTGSVSFARLLYRPGTDVEEGLTGYGFYNVLISYTGISDNLRENSNGQVMLGARSTYYVYDDDIGASTEGGTALMFLASADSFADPYPAIYNESGEYGDFGIDAAPLQGFFTLSNVISQTTAATVNTQTSSVLTGAGNVVVLTGTPFVKSYTVSETPLLVT